MKKILIGFVLLFGCKEPPKEQAEEPQQESIVKLTNAQFKNANISTVKLGSENISETLSFTGSIDVPPQNYVSISSPLGGYLKSTNLLPGMSVRKGQQIAVVEDPQFIQIQQDFLLIKSKLAYAEAEYLRQQTLNQKQASSDKQLQQAAFELENQKIELAGIIEKLKMININPNQVSVSNITKKIGIFSNINGYVSKVNVNIGKYLSPTEVAFELINPADLHLNLKIFEKDLENFKIGKSVLAYSNTHPDVKHPAEVILISKDVSADGSTEVHCHFEKYNSDLIPGMYMNAEMTINQTEADVLPEESVVSYEGKDYVFVEKGTKTYEMVAVEIGPTKNGKVGVKNPTIKHLPIVKNGAYALLMMLKNKEE